MSRQPSLAEAALSRAVEHWNAGDLERYLELYAPEIVMHGIPGLPPGMAGVRGYYEALAVAFPGSRIELDDVMVEGEKVACRFRLCGRHDGPFQGVPASGRDVVISGITILGFRGERCVERWTVVDMLSLLQQIGALPG